MVQLQIVTGAQAGTNWVARRFPVRIGRGPANDLRLEADGVWEDHCEIRFERTAGFLLVTRPDALVTVNHQPAQPVRLRNGDSIEAGAARLRFWLGEPRQRGQRLREALVWVLILTVTLAEVALIYGLLR
jgi:pSer/pThr/pTyr-binding forkhead associated (FHA) protein